MAGGPVQELQTEELGPYRYTRKIGFCVGAPTRLHRPAKVNAYDLTPEKSCEHEEACQICHERAKRTAGEARPQRGDIRCCCGRAI